MDMLDGSAFTEGMMAGPDGCILRFFYDSMPNEQASVAEGRAIFDTVLMVDVITPGQKSSTPRFELERVWSSQSMRALNLNTPSKKSYKYQVYAEFINKFKQHEDAVDLGGTPLKMWPRIDRGLASTLAAVNVYTVEALAALSDANLDHIGLGARELREQAKSFLGVAQDSAAVSQLTDRLSSAERDNKQLADALAVANNRLAALERGDTPDPNIVKRTTKPNLQDVTLA